MARPPFLNRRSATGAHPRATPEQTKPAKGSRLDFRRSWPFAAASWSVLNAALAINAVEMIAAGQWALGASAALVTTLSSALCAFWVLRHVCRHTVEWLVSGNDGDAGDAPKVSTVDPVMAELERREALAVHRHGERRSIRAQKMARNHEHLARGMRA